MTASKIQNGVYNAHLAGCEVRLSGNGKPMLAFLWRIDNNGLRRTNADKRNALKLAWEHRRELFPGEPSHELLAKACGISERTVRRFRNLLTGVDNVHPRGTRLGTDGKTYALSQQDAKRSTETDRYGAAVPERLAKAFDLREYHLRQPHSRPQVRRAVVRLPSMRRRRLSCLWKRWGADDGRIPSQPEGAAG